MLYINIPPVRAADNSRGYINGDIESHVEKLPNQYQDSGLITSNHEQTHFLNSTIRNKFPGKGGFYLLNSRAALLDNPSNITINDVARAIPTELRGMSFSLYLIQSQHNWDKFPLYLHDELAAYINGSEAGLENKLDINSEILQSVEFCLYTSVLFRLSDDWDVLELQQLQLGRAKDILSKFAGNKSNIISYIEKWQNNKEYSQYFTLRSGGAGNTSFL